jgi:rhodanese-related sulfurtransferase
MTRRHFAFAFALGCCLAGFACAPARGADEAKKPADAPPKKITLEEFEKRKAEPDAVVLDVRSPEEFAAGHVPGAVNVPIQSDDFDEKVKGLDKEKTYLVHCAAGVRSGRACKKMTGVVPKLFDFSGGMNEWKKAGKPVEGGQK